MFWFATIFHPIALIAYLTAWPWSSESILSTRLVSELKRGEVEFARTESGSPLRLRANPLRELKHRGRACWHRMTSLLGSVFGQFSGGRALALLVSCGHRSSQPARHLHATLILSRPGITHSSLSSHFTPLFARASVNIPLFAPYQHSEPICCANTLDPAPASPTCHSPDHRSMIG